MTGARLITSIIGVAAGLCFAALAALSGSVLAVPPHFFSVTSLGLPANFYRAYSVVFTAVMAYLAYVGFRVALSSKADEDYVFRAFQGGLIGAFVGLLFIIAMYLMLGQTMNVFFAHSLGMRASQSTMFRLLAAFLWLGFAAGFVLRRTEGG